MAEIKKINTEFQLLDKFLDTSGDAGTSGQVLSSTASGVNWVSGSGLPGGPYLPLAGGTLSGNLTITKSSAMMKVSEAGGGDIRMVAGGSTGYVGTYNNTSMQILQNGSNAIFIDTSKNIGIGVTSPSIVGGTAKLTVNVGSGTSSPVSIVNGTTDGMYIRRYAGNGQYQIQTTSGSGNSGNLSLQSYGGNVGVGVVNPSEKLSVDGNILISDTDNNKYFGSLVNLILNADSDGNSGDTARNIIFQNRGSEKMRITSAGRVGIGTTNPSNELEVLGGGSPRISLRTTSETVGEALELGFQVGTSANSSTNSVGIIKSVITQANPSALKGDLVFQTNSGDSVNTKMVIKDSGNVGIGTTSPGYKLHINGGGLQTTTPTLNRISYYDGSGIGAYSSTGWNIGNYVGDLSLTNNADDKDIIFKTSAGTAAAVEIMRIDGSSGNVGIGTTSPTSALHVVGTQVYGGYVKFENTVHAIRLDLKSSSHTANIYMDGTGGVISGGGLIFNAPTARTHFMESGTSKMSIISGNVGIGTTSPNAKLEVDGGVKIADDTDTASADKVGTMRYRTDTEYVEVTGTEMVTNGNFATDTDWSKGDGITISGGTANFTSVPGRYLSQNINFTNGAKYKINFEITAETSGILTVFLGAGNNVGSISGVGKKEIIATGNSSLDTKVYFGNNFTGSIDNVSVIEVTAEDASYADMCMQTGSSTYEWVNIVRNTY